MSQINNPQVSNKWKSGLGVVVVGFLMLSWLTWGKLVNLVLDSGRETEIPIRLITGQLLYRDVQTYYSPLSFYANAIALHLFGHHLEVFYAVGLVLGLIAILLIYYLTKQLTNPLWTTLCTLCILIYCAFSTGAHGGGQRNFVFPYSTGILYAIVFSLAAFACLHRYSQTRKIVWLIVMAIACGLAGLAKQEYGVAALVSVLLGAALCSPSNLSTVIKRSVLISLIAGVCVIIPFVLLAQQMPWQVIKSSILPSFNLEVLRNSGLLDFSPAKTLFVWHRSLKDFLVSAVMIMGAIACTSWLFKRQEIIGDRWMKTTLELSTSAVLSLIAIYLLRIDYAGTAFRIIAVISLGGLVVISAWYKLAKPTFTQGVSSKLKIIMSVFLAIAFAGFNLYLLRRLSCCNDLVFRPLENIDWILPILVFWFSLRYRQLLQHQQAPLLWTLLAFSIVLNSRFWFYFHYYQLYAFTAIILLFTLLQELTHYTRLPIFKFVVVCLLVTGSVNIFTFTQFRYPVSSTQGVVYTQNKNLALAYNQVIEIINASGAKSVLAIPEGSILNFLTKTSSPSRETSFIPGILPDPQAEKNFLERMQNHPPDFIVYVDYPFVALKQGYQRFAEYNPLVDQWITQQHRLIYTSPTLIEGLTEWTIRVYSR